ncbi:hypothetical protein FO519_004342 [Halicephalobus sp. NKZ332]|nr:hypothetical protein FO519_004342 [Halicephalobus sp. NKZ332]
MRRRGLRYESESEPRRLGVVTGSRLLFNSITEDDTGKYECKAHTSEGTLVTSAIINVGSSKLGMPGDLVSPPLPSVSSEIAVKNPIVGPASTAIDSRSSTEVTVGPSKSVESVVSGRSEAASHWPVEKESYVEQARRVPVIRTVGDEAVLKCGGQTTGAKDKDVDWQKIGGEMPQSYRIYNSDLYISGVKKDDEGLYQCGVTLPGGHNSISFVDLKIADYVPVFHGNAIIDIPPLTDEQWQNLDLELSLKPNHKDGVILHTTKGVTKGGEAENFHTVFLRKGKIVYETKAGNSHDELESKWPIRGSIEQSDECGKEPCQNEGICITANVHEGFRCECSDFFHGSYCQFKTRFCKIGDSCVAGFCVDEGRTSKCICPLDREGLHCEKPIQAKEKFDGSYKFNGKTSFVAIPPPQSVKNFSLGMTVRLQESGDQILAYLGSNYNQKTSEYMAVVLKDGRFVNLYQNGGGKSVIESLEEVEKGKKYKIEISRIGHIAEIKINGKPSSTRVKTVAFPSGTSIFLGGFPPGMTPRSPITQYGFLQGCIGGVELDETKVDIDGMEGILSGDLESCEVDLGGEEVNLEAQNENPQENEVIAHENISDEDLDKDSGKNEIESKEKSKEADSRGDEVILEEKLHEKDPDQISIVEPSLIPATTEKPEVIKLEHNEEGNHLEVAPEKEEISGGTWDSEEKQESEQNEVTIKPTEIVEKVEEEENKKIEPITMESVTMEPELLTVAPESEEKPETTTSGGLSSGPKCEPNTCGEHGDCEIVNTTHVICQCKDYYDGPNCENFKPIEHAARFEGNAYIVFGPDDFPHLTSEREETIAFRLKTTAKYGLIFWQGQQEGTTVTGEDYISIGLNDGYLVYRQVYELGGGAAQIVSINPVNDGKEHIVKVVRRGKNGTLSVDNDPPISGSSSGILAMLNVEGNIYIGGVPDLDQMTGGLHSHNLVGCVADVLLNGEKLDLMGNAIDGVNVKPCDSWRTSKRRWMKSRKYRKLVIG